MFKKMIFLCFLFFINLISFTYSYGLSNDTDTIFMTNGFGKDLRFYLSPDNTYKQLDEFVKNIKNYGINVVIFYDIMPEYGKPYTDKDIWIHPRNEFYKKRGLKKDIIISKEKIEYLISMLHKNQIKAVYYDEICTYNEKYKIYPPINFSENKDFYSIPYFYKYIFSSKLNGPISIYGHEYGNDANIELIKKDYISDLSRTVKELGFDGIFLDSLGWLCELSSFGSTYDGKNLNKSPDEICSSFIKDIKTYIGENFLVIGNNGFYKNPRLTFPKTLDTIDIWLIEFPTKDLIEKISLYPKTFIELNDELSKKEYTSIIYQPFFNISNIYNYNILMALAISNGVDIYHKNDYLGSNLKESIKIYNNFTEKYKKIFYPKNQRNKNEINLKVSKDLLFNYYFIENNKKFVLNLINVKPESKIWSPERVITDKEDNIILYLPINLCKDKNINIVSPENLPNKVDLLIDTNFCKINMLYFEVWATIIIEDKK
jgi:hypothetical protein